MTNPADRVTRVAADLMDSAAAEGARQSRSAKQQLDHWARVGRADRETPSARWWTTSTNGRRLAREIRARRRRDSGQTPMAPSPVVADWRPTSWSTSFQM
jgi:hypothetical protein